MTRVNANTKQGQGIISDSKREGYGDIEQAYDKPSYAKINSYARICERAIKTKGYNHDIRVIGKNCMTYSTIYTFTDADNKLHIVKDTAQNTYEVIL